MVRSRDLTLLDSELVDVDMVDVDMVDVRDAVDVLCSYPDVNINVVAPEATWDLDAVSVNCIGERMVYARVRGSEGTEGSCRLRTAGGGDVDVARFRVRVVMCSPKKGTRDYDCTNLEASAMQLDPDPRNASWGRVSAIRQQATGEWPYVGGNVVVVRENDLETARGGAASALFRRPAPPICAVPCGEDPEAGGDGCIDPARVRPVLEGL